MRTKTTLLALALVVVGAADASETLIPAPAPLRWRVWPSEPPADCPFPRSTSLVAVAFTGRHAEYTGADTWYPSWAADGNLYSPWTDGNVNGLHSSSGGSDATTGHATILGDDPMKLVVTNQGVFKSSPRPYEGRYPCGSLVFGGVWYYGTYCLHPSGRVDRDGIPYNWPWLGPFVGFRWSTDWGRTWTETPCTPERPLFGEHALNGEPVKIGAPHFVDFGKNMQHSPDGKAYLVAHGASNGPGGRRFAYNSWITGDEIYLARVTPAVENMNDASKYEFFAGHDQGGRPTWTRKLSEAKPIASWRDNMGCVTMTYDAPLKKYLMCVTDGGNTVSRYNTYILESDSITGPWNLVSYMKHFGEQAYFVNIPSKFIDGDGRTLWLCYAANFSSGWGGIVFKSRPRGSRYGMCLQQVRILGPGDQQPREILASPENIAPEATVTASSMHPGYKADAVVDCTVAGWPENQEAEWATAGEINTAMVRLTWTEKKRVGRVWLFDRPNSIDQVTGGMLVFSDGSTVTTGPLPDDAKQGLEVAFQPREITWLAFIVTSAKNGTANVGLSELAVWEDRGK